MKRSERQEARTLENRAPALRVPPQRRGQIMLEKIIDSTCQLLMEEPSSSFTVDRVAAEVGASVGNLYRYFRDKNELARVAHSRIADRLDQSLNSRLQATGPEIENVVTALTYGIADWMARHWRAMRTLIFERPMDPVIQARELETVRMVQKTLYATLERDAGRIAHSDLRLASTLAHRFITGPFMVAMLSPEPDVLGIEPENVWALCDDVIRACLGYLLNPYSLSQESGQPESETD